MIDIFEAALASFQLYIGESWHYVIFILVLLYLLFSKEEKKTRGLLWGYVLVFAFLFFCPLTAKIIMDYCIGKSVYWRMLWLLPIPLVIAYGFTRICMRFQNILLRTLASLLLAACIALTGTCLYQPGVTPYIKAENLNKLPPEVIGVCDQINADRGEAVATVTAAYDLVGYIRQYDAGIHLTYGRRIHGKRQEILLAELTNGLPDFSRVTKVTRKLEGNYLVYPTDDIQHEKLLGLGYIQIGQYAPYRIYRDLKRLP